MSNPKVSIIVPVFNSKKYLRTCMDSVLSQTLYDIEVICGDGGSKDGSLDILYDYEKKDARVKVIFGDGHGYGQSVNECFDEAKGEYIGIVESDDLIMPETYETLYEKAKQERLDWIRADIYFYYSELPETEQLQRESIIYDGDFYNMVLNPQTDYRPYKSGLRTWSGIYSRNFLEKNNIRHNETPGGAYQDVGFYLKTLYYAERVYFLDKAFYMWRQDNPGSTIHYDSSKLVWKSLYEWKLNRDYLDAHPELGQRAKASYNYRKFYSYLWTMDMAIGDDREYVRSVAAKEFTEAVERGEIDRGFFAEDEWTRFENFLRDIQQIPDENGNVSEIKGRGHKIGIKNRFKYVIKRVFRPVARVYRKFVFESMKEVMTWQEQNYRAIHAEDDQRIGNLQRSTETLEENVRLQTKLLDRYADILTKLLSETRAMNQELEIINTKSVSQVNLLSSVIDCMENAYKYATETEKEVHEHGEMIQSIKGYVEDIHESTEETKQKVHEQGDVIWKTKDRLEDVHKYMEETGQRVHEQGNMIWSTRDRVEDVYKISDAYLAHPRYGANQKSHNAVNAITSLLTVPEKERRRELCKKYLTFIEIETFSYCNRQCWFCPNHILDRHSDNYYMDETVYKKILSELQQIDYSGKIAFSRYNEPLSDRIILSRIRQAREYCPHAYLHSNTNGDYLTKEYLDELAAAGLNELEVQCYFEKNEAFDFQVYRKRLAELSDKLGLPQYHVIERKENDRFKAIFEYDNLRLTYFAFDMFEFGNNRGESLDGMKEYHRTENCLIPFRKMYVDYNGCCVMCCNVRSDNKKHQPYIVGNVAESTIFDIFCGEKMVQIRKMVGANQNFLRPCATCQYLTMDDDFDIFS